MERNKGNLLSDGCAHCPEAVTSGWAQDTTLHTVGVRGTDQDIGIF